MRSFRYSRTVRTFDKKIGIPTSRFCSTDKQFFGLLFSPLA